MISWSALILSVLGHICIWYMISHDRNLFFFTPTQNPVDVEIVDSQKKDPMGRYVRFNTPTPTKAKPLNLKPRFLSTQEHWTEKETKAAITGRDLIPSLAKGAPSSSNTDSKSDPTGDMLTNRKTQQSGNLARYGNGLTAFSSRDNYLPDIELGAITTLNSERFLYSTFFDRLEDRIVPLWQRNLKNAIDTLREEERKKAAGAQWISQIEVLLDSNGQFLETRLENPSGIPSFDKAAMDSFNQAQSFPNPPHGMLKEDGKIHLRFSFVLRLEESAFARQ